MANTATILAMATTNPFGPVSGRSGTGRPDCVLSLTGNPLYGCGCGCGLAGALEIGSPPRGRNGAGIRDRMDWPLGGVSGLDEAACASLPGGPAAAAVSSAL